MKNNIYYSTGKRKKSIAKIWVQKPGVGIFLINGLDYNQYFLNQIQKKIIFKPISLLFLFKILNIECIVHGGGLSGQAGAICLGISKALNNMNILMHKRIKYENLLTRDSRSVERKKFGQAKARKKFQFSKR